MSPLATVHTPLALETRDGLHLVIHEANLVDYAGMNLAGSRDCKLRVALPNWAEPGTGM